MISLYKVILMNRNQPLSHSGKSMLSGMNTKPTAVTQAEVDAFIANGGEI